MHDGDFDFESYGAECQGCDMFTPINDIGLCAICAAKLDRDMIRQRAWAYSSRAVGLPPDKREQLRKATIANHGAALELITPDSQPKRNRKRRQRRRKK